MSWLPQRWRTQRNAIRHANCKIQWVIKTLNATCTSSEVCLLECLFIPPTKHHLCLSLLESAASSLEWGQVSSDENCFRAFAGQETQTLKKTTSKVSSFPDSSYESGRKDATSVTWNTRLFSGKSSSRDCSFFKISDRTSNQSRIPAEFKHITKRRKRN